MKSMGKRGYGVADIAPMAIMLGLAIVVTVVMADVVTQIQADQTSGSYGYNISTSGLEGLDELGSWFDIVSA